MKWKIRITFGVIVYIAIHAVVTIVDNRQVIDRTEITSKKEYDGPLLMKDFDNENAHIIRSAVLIDSKLATSNEDSILLREITNITYNMPSIPESFMKKFRQFAQKIHSESDDFPLFTLINKVYLNLTLNWLCNVAKFKSRIHQKTLIVSTDKSTCDKILANWPTVSCINFAVPLGYNSVLYWGRQDYINLLTLRVQLLFALTEMSIPFILFETDSTWFRDPMQFFGNQKLVDDADIVVPVKGYFDMGQTITFDPMIVYPTNGSHILFTELKRRLLKDSRLFDQDVLDELCRYQYNGVICRNFEWDDIADGKWFRLADAERVSIKPYIVNNNNIVGVRDKMSRQALNGLWFLTPKGHCVISKVENVLKKHSIIVQAKKKAKVE